MLTISAIDLHHEHHHLHAHCHFTIFHHHHHSTTTTSPELLMVVLQKLVETLTTEGSNSSDVEEAVNKISSLATKINEQINQEQKNYKKLCNIQKTLLAGLGPSMVIITPPSSSPPSLPLPPSLPSYHHPPSSHHHYHTTTFLLHSIMKGESSPSSTSTT